MLSAWVFDLKSIPADLRSLLQDHFLMVLRDQSLTPSALLEVGGQVGVPLSRAGVKPIIHLIPDVAQTDRAETFSSLTAMEWHSDRSFDAETPTWSLLFAEEADALSGRTIWANTALAFEHLPPQLQQECRSLRCRHELSQFAKTYDDQIYGFENSARQKVAFARCKSEKPLIEQWNGRSYLNINRGYTSEIIGRGPEFLEELLTYVEDERFQYAHVWHTGDLVIANNRVLIHRRELTRSRHRVMHRVLAL